MSVDLSLPGAPQAMADALGAAGVDVGVLVNNAGVLAEGPFASGAPDDVLNLLQVNVVALTALTRLFLPAMIARGEGRILNVASIAAFMPVPQLAVYAAAKAYVLSLTEAVGEELRGTGVTATALCPGLTDTAMVRGSELGQPVPAAMIMSPKAVAEAGCAACLRGEAVVVPGLANRLFAGCAPFVPRALARAIRRRGEQRLGAARRGASGYRCRKREKAMTSVRANGITIEYEAFGPAGAPAILLVMGLGMQLIAWPDSLCEGLAARGFRVVRFDNRDVGLSSRMPSRRPPRHDRA